MARTPLVAVLVLALLFSVIPNTMAWRGEYWDMNHEPNTGNDVTDSYDFDSTVMWQDGNAFDRDRIYFNFFTVMYDSQAYIPVPNQEGWSQRSWVFEQLWARLGYWRDCNGDGYIGSAQTGQDHYLVKLGEDEAAQNGVDPHVICPPGSPYRDDLHFWEFLAIGPNARDAANGQAEREQLCPDRNGGPAGHAGSGPGPEDTTPRADTDSAFLDDPGNNNNKFCDGYNLNFVQDDYVKVWADLGLPDVDPLKPTGTITPLRDGTLRDTNGHFRYVDGYLLGWTARNSFGMWPVAPDQEDPAGELQCRETNDGANVAATADNAETGLTRFANDADRDGFDDTTGEPVCSPIPNIRYFDTQLAPVGQIAYPGHLVEDRKNNSETNPNDGSDRKPFTAPFDEGCDEKKAGQDCSGADQDGYTYQNEDCELKMDIDTWDNNPGDGDPFFAYDLNGDPTNFQAWYGPNDDGPSLDPTLGNIWGPIEFQSERAQLQTQKTVNDAVVGAGGPPLFPNADPANADCGQSDTWVIGPIEAHGGGGQFGLKAVATSQGFTFDMPFYFNPSHAPGDPTDDNSLPLDAYLHNCDEGYLSQDSDYLYCGGDYEGGGFIDVPNEMTDYATRSIRWTGYADVSFGVPMEKFNPAGGDGLTAHPHGVFEAPAGLSIAGSVLPAGANDAHQYGDPHCGAVTALTVSGTDYYNTLATAPTAPAPDWNCARDAWAAHGNLDCSLEKNLKACWNRVMVGDPFDFRDVECRDQDLRLPMDIPGTPDDESDEMHTTDSNGFVMSTLKDEGLFNPSPAPDDNLDCDTL